MIRLVKVKQEFYSLCQEHNVDEELLFNEAGRPCVLLIRVKIPHTQGYVACNTNRS